MKKHESHAVSRVRKDVYVIGFFNVGGLSILRAQAYAKCQPESASGGPADYDQLY